MTINELREKRMAAIKACRQFLDARRNERGTLSAEDDATYDRMEQEVTDLGKEIARLERQEALDAELSKPLSKPLTSRPMTTGKGGGGLLHRRRKRKAHGHPFPNGTESKGWIRSSSTT